MKQLLAFLLLCSAAHAQMGANLCPPASATDVAICNGSWQDDSTWQDGTVPGGGEKVLIPSGKTVTNNGHTADILWIHVAGTLKACDHCDTQLNVHTVYEAMGGHFNYGEQGMPLTGKAVVEFLPGPFLPGDWQKLSRGLIAHGKVTINGPEKTAFDVVLNDLPVGATSLQLLNVPLRWAVGDTILISGTDSTVGEDRSHKYQTERRVITAINGRTVTWAEPLVYRHYRWRADLPFHCGNITRNIIFRSRSTATIADRGHVMFMGPMVDTRHVLVQGLGRTDKSQPVTDPRNDAYGEFIVGSDANPRARYAWHAHRVGVLGPAMFWQDVAVDGSPGWGLLVHASHVVAEDCIATVCFGFGLGTEEGQERGAFRRCLSLLNKGQGDTITSTDGDHGIPGIGDWGKDGSGFWLQGGLVEVSDCVSCDNSGRGFALFNRPLNSYPSYGGGNPVPAYLQYPIVVDQSLLPAEYKLTPWWLAVSPTAITSGFVPQRVFARNTAYGNKVGIQSWWRQDDVDLASRLALPADVRGSITDLTLWGRGAKCHLEYTRQFTVDGLKVIGDGLFRPNHMSVTKGEPALLVRFPYITVRRFDSAGMTKRLENVGNATDSATQEIE
jgi:hypothetical protein